MCIRDRQEIETLVEVRSGETLALGGIFSQKNKTARDSVPLLGDIPVDVYKRQAVRNIRKVPMPIPSKLFFSYEIVGERED